MTKFVVDLLTKFVVDFRCDNDSFVPDPMPEVIAILRHVADRLESGDSCDTYRNIVDSNGNIVGTFKMNVQYD